jgi:hypothetical protein
MKNMEGIKTPVALLVFNRPDATTKILKKIAEAKPQKLLVIADGPRKNNAYDAENCRKVREIIKKSVNWPCDVLTNYSDRNLGCKIRVVTGLDWVFNLVEEAIILEDDCIPHSTFFRFCEELLEKYRNNEKVAIISGSKLFISRNKNQHSYYFSNFPQAWGWATWKRFWKNYDVDIKKWLELKDTNWLKNILNSHGSDYKYWENVFDLTYKGQTGTWDYQLVFTAWIQNQLAVMPKVNLVSNIGFGLNKGTHFKNWHKFAELKTEAMQFPLLHPNIIVADKKADRFVKRYNLTYFRPFFIKVFLYICLKLKRWIVKK